MKQMLPSAVAIRSRRRESADTVTLKLDLPATDFAPGQFNMLYGFGRGEAPISVSGPTHKPVTHTIRGVGQLTRYLCGLQPGDTLGLRGPFGTPWPLRETEGRDVLLIAGGIGLAPLRSAVMEIIKRRSHHRRVALLYGAREPHELLFQEDLKRWTESQDVQVEVTVDQAQGDWTGRVGVVTSLVDRVDFLGPACHVFLCGPEVMMRFSARAVRQQNVLPSHIHLSVERSMKCAIGHCGRCQFGQDFVCRSGPVFRLDHIESRLGVPEL